MTGNSLDSEIIRRISANKNEELYLAIAALHPLQIKIIQMRFWEMLTIEQIAFLMCLTWDQVDSIINETLAELKMRIEQHLNSPMPQAA